MIPMLSLLLACSGGETPPAPAAPPSAAQAPSMPAQVRRALELAAAVEAAPANADAALTAKGATRAELEALLFDIARDPALAKAYSDARRR
jgi:hypothetical protein